MSETQLRQSIGPVQMAFYAGGSMLGAGIYALIGQAAGISGNAVWLSFVVALVAALLTGLTYASLGSRHPRAGGTAFIVEHAFRSPTMGFVVGVCMLCSAFIGIPTMARIFAQNFVSLFDMADANIPFVTLGFLAVLGAVAWRGIQESMWVNILCAVVELGGLLFVIGTGITYWGSVDYLAVPAKTAETLPMMNDLMVAVMASTVLTFFAFVGFEDVMNVAEEAKDPQRTLPVGLLSAMAVVALVYIGIAITAVSVVPWQQLGDARSPLTEVVRVSAPYIPPALFTTIALFAITNTMLVNYVTASRLLYGMAQQKLLPALVGRVHETRRTPHIAVAILFVSFIPAALLGSVAQLAAASVLLLLFVFTLMNVSLIILKRRSGETVGKFEIPLIIPVLGAVVCMSLIVARVMTGAWIAPVLAAGIVVVMLAIYAIAQKFMRAG